MRKIMVAQAISTLCLTSLFAFFPYHLPKQVLAEDTGQNREGVPDRRVGGGTRGDREIYGLPVPLVPQNNQGLTGSGNPTFFFYVPKTQQPQMGEFILVDEKEEVIYQTTFRNNGNSGVVGIELPANVATKSLEIGQKYRWFFAIIPNPNDRENDLAVTGSIERVEVDPSLRERLKNPDPLVRADIYAENKLWYDAIATLAQLRRTRPNDATVAAKWAQLLQSANLNEIAREPLVSYQRTAITR